MDSHPHFYPGNPTCDSQPAVMRLCHSQDRVLKRARLTTRCLGTLVVPNTAVKVATSQPHMCRKKKAVHHAEFSMLHTDHCKKTPCLTSCKFPLWCPTVQGKWVLQCASIPFPPPTSMLSCKPGRNTVCKYQGHQVAVKHSKQPLGCALSSPSLGCALS